MNINELLASLDYQEVLATVWTLIIVPILTWAGTQIGTWAKTKKIDKYTNILKENVLDAVKDVQATFVNEFKGTEDWTDERKAEALQLAKDKAIYALTDSAYKALKVANEDFDEYLTTLVEAKLYDLKN